MPEAVAPVAPVAPEAPPFDAPVGEPPLAAFNDEDSVFQLDVRADAVVGRIGAQLAGVNKWVAAARKEKDVVKALCLADRGRKISTLERRARDVRGAVRNALLEDDEAARTAFRELLELEGESRVLLGESNQCIGENVGFVGQSEDVDGVTDRDSDAVPDVEDRAPAPLPEGAPTFRDSPFAAPPVPKPSPIGSAPTNSATKSSAALPAPPIARQGPHDASKLIRTASLNLAVFEVEKKLAGVEQIAKEVGGYLSLRSDLEITVRVPRERFDEALARIETLGDVLHRAISAEDVTDQYLDLELRLKNALVVRDRLEKLLEKANVTDAIQIQKELAKTTEEIERLKGKLELLRDRLAYSSISVTFQESEPERIRSRALLPFPWMRSLGLGPLLEVPR
jgi:hypothetical protein